MIKKIFLLLAASAAALGLTAQHAPGSWRILSMSGFSYEKVVDTPDNVYYLVASASPYYTTTVADTYYMYGYDKENNELSYFSPGGKASDSGISDIFYNKQGKYLLVVYSNGNIDLVYDDGRVINMPEIKDANLTTSKRIYDVKFGNNRIYVGTDFGIVVFDDQRHAVVESGMYGQKISKVMPLGDNLLLLDGTMLKTSPIDNRHSSLDKFENIQSVGIEDWEPLTNNKFLSVLFGSVYTTEINFTNLTANIQTVKDSNGNAVKIDGGTKIQPTAGGFSIFGSSQVVNLDSEGKYVSTTGLPSELHSQQLSSWNGDRSVWGVDNRGLAQYDISGSSLTVLNSKFSPEASVQAAPNIFSHNADGTRVLFSNLTNSEYLPASSMTEVTGPVIPETYEWSTGEIRAEYPVGITADNQPIISKDFVSAIQANADKANVPTIYSGASGVVADLVDPDLYWVASVFGGVMLMKDGEVKHVFEKANSALASPAWEERPMDVSFDAMGNLWIGSWSGVVTEDASGVKRSGLYRVLPKASVDKTRTAIAAGRTPDVDKSEWMMSAFPAEYVGKMDLKLRFSTRNPNVEARNKGLFIRGYYGEIYGYDNKGTTSTSDDVAVQYSGFTDQDGATVDPTHKCFIEQDQNGELWVGTSSGVYVLKDFDQIGKTGSSTLNMVRPKVARNDGTNYADYLLSSDKVLCISTDANNNKWIGTETSGLYQVSPDGTEILQEFNTSNSSLISNTIYMVAANPNGNDVLISTPGGMYVYSSDSAPAADDYSEVYAYPNPVRPDYSGWITINGLMDNSLVKITDSQGHMIWQSKSEGGMAVWDGCDSAGNRVRSGVYLVFASQTTGDSSSGAVTKIVVIN